MNLCSVFYKLFKVLFYCLFNVQILLYVDLFSTRKVFLALSLKMCNILQFTIQQYISYKVQHVLVDLSFVLTRYCIILCWFHKAGSDQYLFYLNIKIWIP